MKRQSGYNIDLVGISNNQSIMKVYYILMLIIMSIGVSVKSQENYNFLDPDLSFDERAEIMLKEMTIEEKISQLTDVSPAVSRLNIPEYNWWNEGLHGVARAGYATVFPQAIGLAATWNDSLVYQVATIISTEFRAKYNDAIKRNDRARYKGLTVWSPNINIFRDPRWGRGQETYGEDPYLTSRLGVMFVRGLQGEHPKYLKTIATPKHFVVHSGPEKLRHVFDVDVSERDFLETYTPAFEACIKEGKAYSIMGAYNRFRGKSCSASDTLLNILLRQKWGFDGYVVSDCDAIGDIYYTHKIVSSPEEAAAIGIKNGCDLNCGNTYKHLKTAFDKALINENDINKVLKRLLLARLKLGTFEPSGIVPYDTISMYSCDNQKHRQLSLLAAQQSIVMLKNNGVLPLNRKVLKKIAIVGPNSNNEKVMFGNYNGTPTKAVTPLEGIKNTVFAKTQVVYYPLNGLISYLENHEPISSKYLEYDGKSGLRVEVYDNISLTGKPIYEGIDTTVNYSWYANSPYSGVKNENISIRWTGKIIVPESGEYSFGFSGDDGYKIWIDGKLEIDEWRRQATLSKYKNFKWDKGEKHEIKIEYFQEGGGAEASLKWSRFNMKELDNTIKTLSDCDVIIYFGGLSPEVEGEEMNVHFDGFDGGDRTKLDLPQVQEEVLKKLKKTGKPVVLVVMAGSAIALNWENKNVDAILMTWYPGQEGGTAIASVIFGDYNPGGRLPVTFYSSLEQLPPFENYDMKNRTYRYFKGEPLYPFGFGLSYSTFKYSNLIVPELCDTKDKLKIKVDVMNNGPKEGDEVVQLYVNHPTANVPVPIHSLKGFKRIKLKAGEKKTVEFELDSKAMAILDNKNNWVVTPGDIDIYVGGQQPNEKLVKDKKVLMGTCTKTGDIYYIK